MNRRPLRTALAALATVCALSAAAPAALARQTRAPRTTPAPALLNGVNIVGVGDASSAETNVAIGQARALHAKVVRTEIPWSVLEPDAPGVVDPAALAETDQLIAAAGAAGMRVIVTVEGSPCWASSAPAPVLAGCTPSLGSAANSWPPLDPAAYGAFTAFLAGRYGSKLAAIEVWNEPDQSNELYFAGPNKARNYAAVLRAAYTAIKAADPAMPVLGGSLVGSNGAFLRALYAAGIKGYYDGLAVHFYTLTLASLRAIREVQLANGDSTPLWLDEFGWSSCWPRQQIQEEQACVTPQAQAANVTNVLRSLARTPYVSAAVVYAMQDSSNSSFGMFAVNGSHKPVFSAFVNALSSPLGPLSPVTVSLVRRRGRVLASGGGPVGDFMMLEAFRGKQLRYRAEFALDRFNRYSLWLPASIGTRGLRVRVFQVGNVAGAAQKKV